MKNDLLKKMETTMKGLISWLETLLAILIVIGVVISGKDIVMLIYAVFITDATGSYQIFQSMLSHVLFIVVGLELALMLISHSAANVIEVILYAIARKMLISSSNTFDILIGVIALALVFAVDKYLHSERQL